MNEVQKRIKWIEEKNAEAIKQRKAEALTLNEEAAKPNLTETSAPKSREINFNSLLPWNR